MTGIIKAIRDIENEFYVKIVEEEELLRQIYELRFQVYCTERDFLPGQAGLESDEFDHRSRHIALLSRKTDELVGTARMVLPSPHRSQPSFPMQQVCDRSLLNVLPRDTSVEISRFAISKQRRSASSAALMRLGLVQGLVRLSAELDLTHWCAVMDPTLLRLLRMTSIYFQPLGPLVEYHGLRQPCFNQIDALLDAVEAERPALWDYLTEGGKTWQGRARQRIAA
jgi:N-acyl-L-homoserine lactone synthetase